MLRAVAESILHQGLFVVSVIVNETEQRQWPVPEAVELEPLQQSIDSVVVVNERSNPFQPAVPGQISPEAPTTSDEPPLLPSDDLARRKLIQHVYEFQVVHCVSVADFWWLLVRLVALHETYDATEGSFFYYRQYVCMECPPNRFLCAT